MSQILDPQVVCPYNNAHKFKQSKLVWHITRCKDKARVQHLFTKCRYNALHIFKKTEIKQHEQNCVDKQRRQLAMQGLNEFIKQNKQEESYQSSSYRSKKQEQFSDRQFISKRQRSERRQRSSSSSSSRSRSRRQKRNRHKSKKSKRSRSDSRKRHRKHHKKIHKRKQRRRSSSSSSSSSSNSSRHKSKKHRKSSKNRNQNKRRTRSQSSSVQYSNNKSNSYCIEKRNKQIVVDNQLSKQQQSLPVPQTVNRIMKEQQDKLIVSIQQDSTRHTSHQHKNNTLDSQSNKPEDLQHCKQCQNNLKLFLASNKDENSEIRRLLNKYKQLQI